MKFKHYKQLDAMDCGPTCLKMIAQHYGKLFSLKKLREECFISKEGVSMMGISDAAESIGFRTMGVRLTFEQLENQVNLPCIVHWKKNHFVVVYDIRPLGRLFHFGKKKDKIVHVADPARGIIHYPSEEFKNAWLSTVKGGQEKGHCLLLEPTPEFYQQEGEIVSRRSFAYLFKYLWPYKQLMVQLVLSFIVASVLQLILPFLTQAIVDKGIQYKDISFLTLVLIAQLALTLGQVSVEFIRGWILLHLTTRVNISILSDFLIKLMRLRIAFFDSKRTGDLIQRIEDNSRIQNFLTSSSVNIAFSLATFVSFGIIVALYDIVVFFVFFGGSALYIVWILIFLKYRRELDNRRFSQMSSNQSNIIQLINGMQEIKLNNCEKQKRWEWEHIQAMLFKVSIKTLRLGQYQKGGAVLINGSKNVVVTFINAVSVIEGDMTLGMMLAVQYIIGQLNSPLDQFIGFAQNWQDAKISLERLDEIHDDESEKEDIGKYKVNDIKEIMDINLVNVWFQYGGPHSTFVLQDINLVIPSNKTTALVGTSGSGKTTMLKMLLGFYHPANGVIKYGNTDLQAINAHVWRRHTGAVMQDGFIFSDTIGNNIALSDDVVDKDKLLYAVQVANIKEFIESLPMSYNTVIGNEGHGISQGQKQRILIARIVYKNPDYVFFDEATNALDANNELTIMNNLKAFFKNKTVVTVAHRLSTVKNADNIIVLEQGKIVEQGTHLYLSNQKGAYYNLVKNQLELGN